jgi:hypothetical protein
MIKVGRLPSLAAIEADSLNKSPGYTLDIIWVSNQINIQLSGNTKNQTFCLTHESAEMDAMKREEREITP